MHLHLLLQKDEHKNFTAIWVFTPTNAGLDFKVWSRARCLIEMQDLEGILL